MLYNTKNVLMPNLQNMVCCALQCLNVSALWDSILWDNDTCPLKWFRVCYFVNAGKVELDFGHSTQIIGPCPVLVSLESLLTFLVNR